jgi:hypothetical protein
VRQTLDTIGALPSSEVRPALTGLTEALIDFNAIALLLKSAA